MTMANLQKLNPTQQELYNYLEQQTGQVNFEVLQPFTTQEMGAVLHISRNTVSQYLNEFFKEGWMGQDQYPAGLLFPAGDAEPEIQRSDAGF